MATAAISQDLERHVSALMVVLDIYPQMMRQMIINSCPPVTIAQLVQNAISNASHPFTRSLNDFEKTIIGKFKTEGYSRCDVSLLYKLIRNFCLVETPTRQWGQKPLIGNFNRGDDVERMKRNRNEIFHLPRGSLSEDEKNTFFQESEEIASRIDDLIGRPANGFVNRIQSLKIYSVTREKYIQILEKYNDLQERFQKKSESVHVDLYYGNDIAAKFEPENVEEPSGVTNCSIYLRDPNMDVSIVIEKLDEVKQKLNEGNFGIKLRGSENKCLVVHIEIDNKCFTAKELLHKVIHIFLQKLFKLASLDNILRSPVEVVLVESDNTYEIDNTEDSYEDMYSTDHDLKLDVSVKDNIFQSEAHLYEHVNEFCNEIFQLTNQKIPTNGSSLGVVMTVQTKNVTETQANTSVSTDTSPAIGYDIKFENQMQSFTREQDEQWTGQVAMTSTGVINEEEHKKPVGVVPNASGGYTFAVSDEIHLLRYLVLGTERGSYYELEHELKRNIRTSIDRLIIEGKSFDVVSLLRSVSVDGRAYRQTSTIQALAICARSADPKTQAAAYDILIDVCRIPTHLFEFLSICEHESSGTGWGRAHRSAVGKWYNQFWENPKKLAYLATKYKARHNWNHKDVLRLAHVKPKNTPLNTVFRYIMRNQIDPQLDTSEESEEVCEFLSAIEEVKQINECDIVKVRGLIAEHQLALEHLPLCFLNSKEVWDTLLREMPTTATIYNLGKMSSLRILDEESFGEALVVSKLGDRELLKKSRIHPFTVLISLYIYRRGRGDEGKLSWPVNDNILKALENAFYMSFNSVPSTGKRFCLAVDVSESMTMPVFGSTCITTRVASAAMMLLTAKTEAGCEVVAFSDRLTQINITSEDTLKTTIDKTLETCIAEKLQTTIAKCPSLSSYRKDCALPIKWAMLQKKKFDVFVVYTDSEINYGNIHPATALQLYRNYTNNAEVRLIVVGMTSNGFTIADPKDPLMIDVIGFDTEAPKAIADFVLGKV